MRPKSRKSGFTLVELLVVIAIIGTLMGLLLPAVQSAREAGRRNTCSNNLSQLGKAVVSFDGRQNSLPGWRNPNVVTGSATFPTYSWPIPLLPNLERRDIFNFATLNSGSLPATPPYIDLFACPSAPPDSTATPVLAYVGNAGAYNTIAAGGLASYSGSKGDGVLFDANSIRIGLDFIGGGDGTSNTLLFSEKCGGAISSQSQWATTQASSTCTLSGSATATPVFTLSGTSMVGKAINTTTLTGFTNPQNLFPSSNHPGGAMAVFCDGHVQFLKDSIIPAMLSQLMTSKTESAGTASTNANGWNLQALPLLDEGQIK